MGISLVVPAAGRGTRFGGEIPKQFRQLAGRSVLARSVEAFAGLIDEVVLVIQEQSRDLVEVAMDECRLDVDWRTVVGGSTRQASVAAGLFATDPDHEFALIHDAARPLVHSASIAACIDALESWPGAVVAIPCSSSVKRVADDRVTATVPRSDLYLAQTPQGVHRSAAVAAFTQAEQAGWQCTDDVEVMERAGHEVVVVPGTPDNLKLTTAEDLVVAEALIAYRQAVAAAGPAA